MKKLCFWNKKEKKASKKEIKKFCLEIKKKDEIRKARKMQINKFCFEVKRKMNRRKKEIKNLCFEFKGKMK